MIEAGEALRGASLHSPYTHTRAPACVGNENIRLKAPQTVDCPLGWRLAFAVFDRSIAPCPGFPDREWPLVRDVARAFLYAYAGAAHALGWTAAELFGVHRTVGASRVDCCGALMVSAGATVVAVEQGIIHFERKARPTGRYFRSPVSPLSIPVWEFGR